MSCHYISGKSYSMLEWKKLSKNMSYLGISLLPPHFQSSVMAIPTLPALNMNINIHAIQDLYLPLVICFKSLIDALPRETASESVKSASVDGALNYASAVLNDGMMFLEFKDAIREGDGPRIIRCWKVF